MTIFRRDSRLRQRRKLHHDCTTLLADLATEDTANIRTLCERLGRQRGRPIRLLPIQLDATHPSGFWIAVGGTDFIVFDENTSGPHQEHIIAHELAHMICCHRGTAALDSASAKILFPNLDPNLVQEMLGRAGYSDEQEQEAEVLATLLLQKIMTKGDQSSELTTVGRRIKDSLT